MISQDNEFFWVYGHCTRHGYSWLPASTQTAPQNARSENNLGLIKVCLRRVEELSERGHKRALLFAR